MVNFVETPSALKIISVAGDKKKRSKYGPIIGISYHSHCKSERILYVTKNLFNLKCGDCFIIRPNETNLILPIMDPWCLYWIGFSVLSRMLS